jgi:hypothetical protein
MTPKQIIYGIGGGTLLFIYVCAFVFALLTFEPDINNLTNYLTYQH